MFALLIFGPIFFILLGVLGGLLWAMLFDLMWDDPTFDGLTPRWLVLAGLLWPISIPFTVAAILAIMVRTLWVAVRDNEWN